MANFQYMIQPQGVTVPISIFGAADAAGIQSGNAQKTTAQAISEGIQGAIKGYTDTEAAFQVNEAREQENTLREQQIKEIPLREQQLQAQIENAENVNEANALKLKEARLTQDLSIKAQKAQLEANVSTLAQQKQTQDTRTAILDSLKSAKIEDRRKIFNNTGWQAIMFQDPKFAEGVYNALAASESFETKEEQKRFYNAIGYTKSKQLQAQIAQTNENARIKQASQLETLLDKVATTASLAGLPPDLSAEDLATRIESFPAGQKHVDKDTGRVIPGADTPLNYSTDEYDLFLDGKLLEAKTDAKGYETLSSYKRAWAAANGDDLTKPSVTNPDPINKVTGVAKAGQGGTPSVYDPFAATESQVAARDTLSTNAVIAKTQKRFRERIANLPEGQSARALERRLEVNKKEIRRRFGVTPKRPPSAAPTPEARMTPTPTPTRTPEERSNVLGSIMDLFVGSAQAEERATVELNTATDYTPTEEVQTRINTQSLTSSEPALIKGMISIESRGDPNAISPTKVKGIMQVTKPVADQYGLNRNIPEENLLAGKKYLTNMLEMFDGNLYLALAAYNAGPGILKEAVKATKSIDWTDVKAWLKDNLSESKYDEVAEYPDKVITASTYYMQEGNDTDLAFAQLMLESGAIKLG
jgi:hypothetical protein